MGISPEIKINGCLNMVAKDGEDNKKMGVSCLLFIIDKADRESQYEAAKLMAQIAVERTDINSTNLFKWLYKKAREWGDYDLSDDIDNAAVMAVSPKIRGDHTTQIDIKELKFCLSAKLGELAQYLTAKTPLEQARMLVVLKEFRSKLAFQLQFHVDIAEASNIVVALNERLFISQVDSDRELTGKERAIAKYFILLLLNTEAGTNLQGKHYNDWINIKGVPKDKDGNIINITVDIDQSSRAHRQVMELISVDFPAR